jgi:hypothetical protein
VLEEAHLSPDWIFDGIKRFADERNARRAKVSGLVERLRD